MHGIMPTHEQKRRDFIAPGEPKMDGRRYTRDGIYPGMIGDCDVTEGRRW